MINNDTVDSYKTAILSITDVQITEEKNEDEGSSHIFIIKNENTSYLIKIQNAEDEYSKTKHIFSINFVLRINNVPKIKKEIDLLNAINKFNQRYEIVKCMLHKNDGKNTFWFRSESLTNSIVSSDLITNMISVLKSSPKLLTSLIKAG
ncbi:hypothetical protein QUH50_11590 [Klebsiella variicola]|uniref:hypothetical protein n=1 Tax=Klebsiella variicola TaxID=244366 RepID=UPI0025A05C41|nr:hypothetical protein [Klebsiella variicola]MDM7172553.1 hypothetical protein [Klebsiella variicola]